VSGVVPVAEGVPELSGLGVLTWVYPPDLVDRVVAACGRTQRRRLLPARLVVYFVLALALFSPAPYLEVLRHLTEGLRDLGRWGSWRMPAKSSLFRARERLGAEPLRVLFAATAGPLATPSTPGRSGGACGWWRWTARAGTRPTRQPTTRSSGVPAASGARVAGRCAPVRMVALVECGTHAVVDAELDGCRVGEVTLAARVARSAGPGMLLLPRPGVPRGAAVARRGRHRAAPASGEPGMLV
jgi:Insertion element 4 transposase N-terminal